MEQDKLLMVSACLLLGIVALTGLLAAVKYFRNRRAARDMDQMEGHAFEAFCAELLEQHGFQEVEVTRGSGDFGVDVLAQKDGVTYAVQCKRYQSPVGVEAVLRTYGGRDYYGCMVGAVMTNQYFTEPAVKAAQKLHILLWDRGYLDSMMEERSAKSAGPF